MKLRFIHSGIAIILCSIVAGCEAPPTVPPFDGNATLLLSRTPPAISDAGTPVLGATHLASEEADEGEAPTATPAPIDISNCFVNGDYIEDLTIPDDTTLRPGESFTKTWRMLNSGTCDWGTGFGLVFVGGAQMDGLSPAPVPDTIPGEEVDLSVHMIAPLNLGTYTGVWKMQAPDGSYFGINVYVRIEVAGEPVTSTRIPGTRTPTPISTPNGPTPTPGNCTNNSEFVLDVSIPDDTAITAGTTFTKTWRLRNNGTCPWGQGYALALISGAQMTTSTLIPLAATAAGATVDLPVTMIAPTQPGTYSAVWQMISPQGTLFGAQPYLRIVVTPPSTGTPQIYQLPQYLSNVTPRAREIFLQGQAMGNTPNVFAKVGDSLSDESWFLYAVGEGRANLQGYQNLQDAVDFFISGFARTSNSFADDAISAAGGWDSFALLDPAKAAGFAECAGLNPVECEIQNVKPSVAIILIGSNDGEWNVSNGLYGGNIRRIVQICIDNGVVPVLTTVPWSVYRVDPSVYNNVIVSIAAEYQIPVIDYATPMYGLPNHGVRDDGVHPSVPPDLNPANFSNENLQFGYTLRNLLTLQMLDALYHTVLY